MTTIDKPNAQTLLEFANLQVASEAFLLPLETASENPKEHIPTGNILEEIKLTEGNKHSTKFTPTMAEDFVGKWKVVDHISNTKTGFSGTLFEATKTITDANGKPIVEAGQQVLSFRSTEFIEDAVHDNKSTNQLEIKENGFAFGQISDMVDWVKSMQDSGIINNDIKVTGYSLGAHIATAFNVLQKEGAFDSLVIDNTFTFNGAGIGKLKDGKTLTELITQFSADRNADYTDNFNTEKGKEAYNAVKSMIADGATHEALKSEADRLLFVSQDSSGYTLMTDAEKAEYALVGNALGRILLIRGEIDRIQTLDDGKGAKPYDVKSENVAGAQLDYQLAVLQAAEHTHSVNTDINIPNAIDLPNNTRIQEPLPGVEGFFDIFANNPPSMIAISQVHHGNAVIGVRIEDQPLRRGDYVQEVHSESESIFAPELLVNHYGQNAFGDTHSITLLIDSLATQAVFEQLDNSLEFTAPGQNNTPDTANISDKFEDMMQLASSNWGVTGQSVANDGLKQGRAEGDALDNLVNALWATLGIDETFAQQVANTVPLNNFNYHDELEGNPNGGSWAESGDIVDDNGKLIYTGRDSLHQNLNIIAKKIAALADAGSSISIELIGQRIDGILQSYFEFEPLKRDEFENIIALKTLSPFVIKSTGDNLKKLWETETWKDDYERWLADEEQIKEGQTQALNFSQQWLADRNKFLEVKLAFNADNKFAENGTKDHKMDTPDADYMSLTNVYTSRENGFYGKNYYLSDLQKEESYRFDYHNKPVHRIVFGTDKADSGEKIDGKEAADHLYGERGDDTIHGNGDSDYIEGNQGKDHLYGDAGNDSLIGGTGNDTLEGGDGHDFLYGGDDDDTLKGDTGNDLLVGGQGKLSADGGEGNDLIKNFASENAGVDGNELKGGQGNDLIYDSDGKDTLSGDEGNDQLFAGSDDKLDTLTGGAGNDILTLTQQHDPNSQSNEPPKIVDKLDGGAGSDVLDASSGVGADMTGGAGSDHLLGGIGEDSYRFAGNFGTDIIKDSDGLGKLYFDGAELSVGEYDNDKRCWHSEDGQYELHWLRNEPGQASSTSVVAINKVGDDKNTVFIEDFQSGQFGLYFSNEPGISDNSNSNGFVLLNSGNNIGIFNHAQNVDGETGNDRLLVESGKVQGGGGNDFITVYGSKDSYLDGGADNDIISAGSGNDEIYGGDGNDFIISGAPLRLSIGGQHFSNASGQFIVHPVDWQGDEDEPIDWDRYSNFNLNYVFTPKWNEETKQYSAFLNTANGGSPFIFISPEFLGFKYETYEGDISFHWEGYINSNTEGNDWVDGGAGEDYIVGSSAGHDELYGQDGNDYIMGYGGNDKIYGGKDDDHLYGGAGRDLIDGGDNKDNIAGGYGSDVIYGGEGDDSINGDVEDVTGTNKMPELTDKNQLGDDLVYGGSGADGIWGNLGNDTLYGESGEDYIDGGQGEDYIDGGTENDILSGGMGNDYLYGSGGDDTLYGFYSENNPAIEREGVNPQDDGNDYLFGGGGSDNLYGGKGDDYLDGGAGDDSQIDGGEGNDILKGGGADNLYGQAGDDILFAGAGAGDQLHGGKGADTYVFNLGDGVNTIHEIMVADTSQNDNNTVRFMFSADNIKSVERVNTNDLKIAFGDADSVIVKNYYNANNISSHGHQGGAGNSVTLATEDDPYTNNLEIASFQFLDGTVWDAQQIMAMAPPPEKPFAVPDSLSDNIPYFIDALITRGDITVRGKTTITYGFLGNPNDELENFRPYYDQQKAASGLHWTNIARYST